MNNSSKPLKTVQYMTKDGIRERNAKTDGIKGRSNRIAIENRRKCIQAIFNEYDKITKSDLMLKMKENSKSYGFSMPSSPTTISNDLTALGLKVDRVATIPKEEPDELVAFEELGKKIKDMIRQIRVACMDEEHILYQYSNDKKNDFKDYESFFKPMRKIVNTKKKTAGLKSRSLHIFIVLNQKSMEDYIGEVFTSECEWVLYTSSHVKCVEIVTTLGKTHMLMKRIYSLL